MHCPKCDGRMEHCIMVETGEAPKSGWFCEVCGDLMVDDEPPVNPNRKAKAS